MNNNKILQYCTVWIRGVRGLFSWHTDLCVDFGSRVVVRFRGKRRVGVVVCITQTKPDFLTQPVLEVWNRVFIPKEYISMAQVISSQYVTSLEKVLSLMVPQKFMMIRSPEKRTSFYVLRDESIKLSGSKQRLAVEMLQKSGGRLLALELERCVSRGTLKTLLERGIVEREQGSVLSLWQKNQKVRPSFFLTSLQQQVLDNIESSSKPVLLFGVTGSGKTEVYKKLAQRLLDKLPESQVLFLLPEIALTSQLIAEFYGVFGDLLAVWHSKLSEGEKVQAWERMRSGEGKILIGTRSAVFVPLQNPQLIILDEEHEWTFKNNSAPRIWTHDVVQILAEKFESKLVFGSATPRAESFYQVDQERWHRVDMLERVHQVQLPSIEVIDLANEAKKGNTTPFSEHLQEEIRHVLQSKKQVILFLNKRGYHGATFCKSCGHTFECPSCSYLMKMHQQGGVQKFVCHVCGHLEHFPEKCPKCQDSYFLFRGWGTQMVEKVLQEFFPGIRVLRADSDSMTGKYDFERVLSRFHNYEADVLLGTQMIAKGLDFERVHLVGVILADVGLNLPDFRSEERVFQLLTQVSGRAGRRQYPGKIILQTFQPRDPIFDFVKNYQTEDFIRHQLLVRQKMGMPPFSSLVKITFSDADKKKAFEVSHGFFKQFCNDKVIREDQISFAPAFFPRAHGKYHFHVFLRGKSKENLLKVLSGMSFPKGITIDIDPVSLL